MRAANWPTSYWPENVAFEVGGYGISLFSILDEAARSYPDEDYTVFEGSLWSFSRVRESSDRVAAFLEKKGLRKGDRAALVLPNIPHYPVVFFGILKAGAVCVPCNPFFTSRELNHQLKDSGAKALFCMGRPELYSAACKSLEDTDVETVVVCGTDSFIPEKTGKKSPAATETHETVQYRQDHIFFDDIMEKQSPDFAETEIDPFEDLAAILYTSGTTGMPKGAALTHSNFAYNLRALDEWVRLPQEPGGSPEPLKKGGFHTYLGIIPWHQSFGLTVCMLAACWSASRLICIPDPAAGDPPFTEALKAVEKYRATIMPAVPAVFNSFVNHPNLDEFDLASLSGCFSGGAPLTLDVCTLFEEKTGAVIFEGYGLSETAPVAAMNPTSPSGRKMGTIGFPLPGTDVRILDYETGTHEMPQGADGEIAVCGPQVMKGYWQQPDADKSVFREIEGRRYFLTGDIGCIDEDGYILITSRKKELILVSGFNVYPREVENTLYQNPKIEMAAVVGTPDSQTGEAVKAFIQLREGESATEEEIRDFCRESLASYKCPKIIEFREALPVSPAGKLVRHKLTGNGEPGS